MGAVRQRLTQRAGAQNAVPQLNAGCVDIADLVAVIGERPDNPVLHVLGTPETGFANVRQFAYGAPQTEQSGGKGGLMCVVSCNARNAQRYL